LFIPAGALMKHSELRACHKQMKETYFHKSKLSTITAFSWKEKASTIIDKLDLWQQLPRDVPNIM